MSVGNSFSSHAYVVEWCCFAFGVLLYPSVSWSVHMLMHIKPFSFRAKALVPPVPTIIPLCHGRL